MTTAQLVDAWVISTVIGVATGLTFLLLAIRRAYRRRGERPSIRTLAHGHVARAFVRLMVQVLYLLAGLSAKYMIGTEHVIQLLVVGQWITQFLVLVDYRASVRAEHEEDAYQRLTPEQQRTILERPPSLWEDLMTWRNDVLLTIALLIVILIGALVLMGEIPR